MKKVFLLIGVFIFSSSYATSYIPYAEILAEDGIIVQHQDASKYRVGDFVWRQEIIGMAVKVAEIDLDAYGCTEIFLDASETAPNTWICRAAEAAASAGIITHGANFPEQRIQVKPEKNISRSEALAMMMDALEMEYADQEVIDSFAYDAGTVEWQKRIIATAKQAEVIDSTLGFGANVEATRGEIFEMTVKLLGEEGEIEERQKTSNIDAIFKELEGFLRQV